jgi:hypothetical protein
VRRMKKLQTWVGLSNIYTTPNKIEEIINLLHTNESTDVPASNTTHTHKICCCITVTYNKQFNVLTYNFSKEQYVLPEDDLRIEICRSVLNVLV